MTYTLLLFGHWVGDFALQTTPMALNKSRSLKWLSIHVAAYMAPIIVICLFIMPLEEFWPYIGLNTALHWITDFFTSKWAYIHRKNPRKFYPIIGLDQFIHTGTLYLTLDLFK